MEVEPQQQLKQEDYAKDELNDVPQAIVMLFLRRNRVGHGVCLQSNRDRIQGDHNAQTSWCCLLCLEDNWYPKHVNAASGPHTY